MIDHTDPTDSPDHSRHPNQPERYARPVYVRGEIPGAWAKRLKHLEAETGLTRPALVQQAILLLLRHHGLGDDLPAPVSPVHVKGEGQ